MFSTDKVATFACFLTIDREILEVEYLPESMMKDDLDAKSRHAHNERQRTGFRRQDRRDKSQAYSTQVEDEW